MARRQPYRDVLAIMEYRRARQAVDLFNAGQEGAAELAKRPELLDLLVEIHRAQSAGPSTIDDVYASLRAAYPAPNDTDED